MHLFRVPENQVGLINVVAISNSIDCNENVKENVAKNELKCVSASFCTHEVYYITIISSGTKLLQGKP